MPRPDPARIADRLRTELGDRLREFPLEVRLHDGVILVVLRGAAGSVTALRGLREKLQPVMKRLLREQGRGPRFATVEGAEQADLVLRVELPA